MGNIQDADRRAVLMGDLAGDDRDALAATLRKGVSP
jgi:hypothetical protein